MWKTSEYTATGRGHLKAGIPCQDKVRAYRCGEVTVITLADGAGSAKLSHFGAEAVLDRISKNLGEYFEEYFMESDASVIRQRLFSEILEALEETQVRLRCDLKDLSSTLLAVAVCGSRYFIIHIGDGVIGYLRLYLAAVAVVALEITGDDHGRYELQQRYDDHDGGESPRSVRNDGGVHDGGQQGRPERWQKIELSPGDAVKVVAQLLVAFSDALVSEI